MHQGALSVTVKVHTDKVVVKITLTVTFMVGSKCVPGQESGYLEEQGHGLYLTYSSQRLWRSPTSVVRHTLNALYSSSSIFHSSSITEILNIITR